MDKEPEIIVRKPDATMQPTLQDNQLMSKHRVLSFKPQLRLEWRGQGRSERNRAARSFRQLRRFHHFINSDKVFGTHRFRHARHCAAMLLRAPRSHISIRSSEASTSKRDPMTFSEASWRSLL